jgi:hypothetical protein
VFLCIEGRVECICQEVRNRREVKKEEQEKSQQIARLEEELHRVRGQPCVGS